MKRKTDDNIILKMLRNGDSQKKIAEFFDVSPAAICKRVKKLLDKKPESFENLTERQQKFAIAIAEGKTQTQAALDSHECSSMDSAKSLGYQLAQKSDIQTAVSEIMQTLGLSKHYRVQRLKTHIDHPDPNVSLKGLDQSWKLNGAYTEKHVHVHMTHEELIQAEDEAKAKVDRFEQELRAKYSHTVEGEIVDDKDD